jgi:SAM-dependent methyltransferase
MPPMADRDLDIDALSANIRAEIDRRRGQAAAPDDAQRSGAVALVPERDRVRSLLEQAQRVANVGATVPPFGVFGPLRRRLAQLVTRTAYYFLQVITVDQRVFNNLLVDALTTISNGLRHGESGLATGLTNLERAIAEGETRIERSLAQQRTDLQQALILSDARLSQLEVALRPFDARVRQLEETLAPFDARLRQLEETLAPFDARLRQLEEALTPFDARLRQLEAAVGPLGARLDRVEGLASDERLRELRRAVDGLRLEATEHSRRVGTLLEEIHTPKSTARSRQKPRVATEAEPMSEALYVAFEEEFRGTREEIVERQRVYLPIVQHAGLGADDSPILDIGCGRGEWLELLQQNDLRARGVDLNSFFVEQGRQRGLDIAREDALAHLRTLPDQSLGAVTAFQLIEHLPFEVFLKLLDESLRVLRSGGVAMFETPNPGNVVIGSCSFYYDPSHLHPLPAPATKFFLEARGFRNVDILYLNPPADDLRIRPEDSALARQFNQRFYAPQDYAVVGWKP